MIMKVIGICGSRRVGKDTIADIITNSNFNYEKVHIASKLKSICKQLFDFTDEQLNSDEKDIIDKRYNISPRKILQFFGTELMQFEIQKVLDCGRDFWIDDFVRSINNRGRNVVVSDIRFFHEYKKLKETFADDFIIIKVNGKQNDDKHIAENEWREIPHDFEINNDSTIDKLRIDVIKTIKNEKFKNWNLDM